MTGATAAATDDCLITSGGVPFTKEPAYRRHKTSTKSALGMLIRVFASSQFVEEWRTTDEAQTTDRLIAG
jgi:hypothetical protein